MARKPVVVEPIPDGTHAARTADELSALDAAFKERKAKERARFQAATDSEYWFAVCFRSRAEKEAFLDALGLLDHGDKYLDGATFAEAIALHVGTANEVS
jgi:hypothetical protein